LGADIDEFHELVEAGEHDVVARAVPDLAEGDHVAHISLVLGAVILLGEFTAFSQFVVNLEGFVFLWFREIQHCPEPIEEKGVFRVDHECPARVLRGLEDRIESIDVAHGEFAEDEALGFGDDALDLLIDLVFRVMVLRVGRHPGALAEKGAGLRSGGGGDEVIGQMPHRAVPPEIGREGDVPGGGLDDIGVGARSGMLDMNRSDGQVFDADRVAAFEQTNGIVLADINQGREEGGIGVDNRLGLVAHVKGNIFIQEGKMPDVIAVVMGEEYAVDIGFLVGQVGELELGAAVELRGHRNYAEFEVAFEPVGRARLQPFIEIILTEIERFAKIEVDLGAGRLEEEFIAADFPGAPIEGKRSPGRLRSRCGHGSKGQGIIEGEAESNFSRNNG